MKRSDEIPFEEETARKKKLTSVVWETFTPMCSSGLRDGLIDSAKCNVCSKVFSTRHGTSSMMRHAKRHSEFPNGASASAKKPKKSNNGASASSLNGSSNSSGSSSNGINGGGGAKKSPALKKGDNGVVSSAFDETSAGTASDRSHSSLLYPMGD